MTSLIGLEVFLIKITLLYLKNYMVMITLKEVYTIMI